VIRALAALAVALLLLAGGDAHAQIARRLDRVVYSVHVNVAAEIDLAELRLYLAEASRVLQSDQGAEDVACCVALEPISLEVFGTPDDGLDVIESSQEFYALNGRRAIVQTINWCGSTNPSLIGCAETPGDTLVVGFDAGPEVMGRLIAHERGHNANLSHRSDSSCALMAPYLAGNNGCLTAGECTMYRSLMGVSVSGACDCMGPGVGDPVDADGSACSASGAAGYCHDSGICSRIPANDDCAAATPLTGPVERLETNDSASTDGAALCAAGSADVWYHYTPQCTGRLLLDLCDSDPDLLISVRDGCGPGQDKDLMCSAGCAVPARSGCRSGGACVSAPVVQGFPLVLRVAAETPGTGPFVLRARCEPGPPLDRDGDTIPDASDVCPSWPDPAQRDRDGNGIGDVCECGDQNGDGIVSVSDLIAIKAAAYTPALATPLCDANEDRVCDVSDIVAANAKIFGVPAFCSRYPSPGG
jgi:hypothetical protein